MTLSRLGCIIVVVDVAFLISTFRSMFHMLCYLEVVSLPKVLCLDLIVDEVSHELWFNFQ